MGRTCKLHAERPLAGNQTKDLAARQQCYQLNTVNLVGFRTSSAEKEVNLPRFNVMEKALMEAAAPSS
ncbi:hypothetical protein ILYODFUR_038728 [Ilyodon furcidens]|uniref:Uncharacterized protein n=1 Tax=Ilyodon furcidens TaxID=33524 RepID=A0ABV0UQP7_9TELE